MVAPQHGSKTTILDHIVQTKRQEVERARARLPAATLRDLCARASAPRGFAAALSRGDGPRIITEVKRASPSKGVLRPQDPPGSWKPDELAQAYERGGAAALSVLTDVHGFWGHPDALEACRAATRLPALRKDFIVDIYQVDESRWLGADAILLIARILNAATMQACNARARELGMDVLVEVHDESELDAAVALPGALVGVNNRDLANFKVDMQRSARMRQRIPADRLCIAESGLSQPEELRELMAAGVNGFLIGETVAAHDNPEAELRRLRGG